MIQCSPLIGLWGAPSADALTRTLTLVRATLFKSSLEQFKATDTTADDHLIEFGMSRHDSGIFSTTSMVLASMEVARKLHKEGARDLLCIMTEPKCVQRRVYGE